MNQLLIPAFTPSLDMGKSNSLVTSFVFLLLPLSSTSSLGKFIIPPLMWLIFMLVFMLAFVTDLGIIFKMYVDPTLFW